jgi:hypothetical protein
MELLIYDGTSRNEADATTAAGRTLPAVQTFTTRKEVFMIEYMTYEIEG